MLDTLKPALTPGAQVRARADGSVGVHDPGTGRHGELGADQATLLALLDGTRTVAEVADAHASVHQFVPFVALRDLLARLALERLLSDGDQALRRAGLALRRPRLQRWADVRLATLPFGAAIAVILVLAGVATAALGLSRQEGPGLLTAYDVLWAYVGAAVALTLRAATRAVAVLILGGRVQVATLASTFGVLHLAPDGGAVALMERPQRALVHLCALAGAAFALSTAQLSAGLGAGALAVLVADLCPFAPTSAGRLLAALAGRVDLREHARAYLSRRLLRRVAARSFFSGEISLLLSALLSLAWIGLLVRLVLTRGVSGVLELVGVGVGEVGLERGLAYLGALVLLLLIPASLLLLAVSLARAILSLRPAERAQAGRRVEAGGAASDLTTLPLFSQLAPEDAAALAAAAFELAYEPGQSVVVQGEAGDRFYAIKRGQAAVLVHSDSGLVTEVARLGPGDCFGEIALLERRARTATVRALEPLTCSALSHDAFKALRQSVGDQVTAVIRSTSALNRSPLFSQLASERRSALALRLRPLPVTAGQTVVREGEAGDSFFLVADGELEVVSGTGGRVSTLAAGDHFGEVALLRNVPRTATVRAVRDGLLLSLDKREFLAALSRDLSVSTRLEELAAARLEAPR